jgi:uncharacterized protein involved in tellurium resistance
MQVDIKFNHSSKSLIEALGSTQEEIQDAWKKFVEEDKDGSGVSESVEFVIKHKTFTDSEKVLILMQIGANLLGN